MGDKFWEGIGEKLADRWAAVSVPAFTFWLGGLVAWMIGHGGTDALTRPASWVDRYSAVVQAVIIAIGLLLVAATGVVVGRLTGPALVVMEGYWPPALQPLRDKLTDRVTRKVATASERFQALAGPVHDGSATDRQRDEYAKVDRQLRRIPHGHGLLPTRTGNTLRAAETRPIDKYGLDAVALWPHLWLLLPDSTRRELAAARSSLDAAVGACVWGLLFLVFIPLTWWALPAGLIVTIAGGWIWVPARAEVFADLVEAAFDLHRISLYKQLRWPLPVNPAQERISGRQLTQYLMRGLSGTSPTFTAGPADAAADLPEATEATSS